MPEFAHAPLIFDPSERAKLSKRKHGEAVHINKYRVDGYMPEAMVNYLAAMSWTSPDGKEFFSLQEACEMFDLYKISKSPAVFDSSEIELVQQPLPSLASIGTSLTERAKPYLTLLDTETSHQLRT